MSRVPAPSRRVLTALIETLQPLTLPPPARTAVERMFNDLRTLVEQQNEAFIALDRLSTPVDSKDEARAAYRTVAAREERLADAIADTAAALLIAPIEHPCDLQFKLMVLIAVSEPHPDDAYIFPGLYLRALLTDLGAILSASTGNSSISISQRELVTHASVKNFSRDAR